MAGSSLYESAYTSIDEKDCHTISTHDLGATQLCKSFAKIDVKVIESDLRQTITLERNGTPYPLELWRTVSSAWSLLGKKIEWRYPKNHAKQPIAMIVRFKVSENPDNADDMTSYLVVSKITQDQVCVVGKIPPQANQNQLARDMADRSAGMRCIGSVE
jgi:hypothetical protein